MNRIPATLLRYALPVAAWLTPTLALACPGSRAAACSSHSCGLSGGGSYLTAVGLGLAIGLGSSALESIFRRARG